MFESLSTLNSFDVTCGLAGLRFRVCCLSPTVLSRLNLFELIKKGIGAKLRCEQARFLEGKGSIELMFILRNIIEQSIKWQAPLHIDLGIWKQNMEDSGILSGIVDCKFHWIRIQH